MRRKPPATAQTCRATPDKFDGTVDEQREFRERGVPSGLANEIYPDVCFETGLVRATRPEPSFSNACSMLKPPKSRASTQNGDGIISAVEGDVDTATDGLAGRGRVGRARRRRQLKAGRDEAACSRVRPRRSQPTDLVNSRQTSR
jgi:hypothetical protein